MKRPFTDEDIIRFLFDEMSQAESEHFLNAICADEVLWDRYEHFQEMVEQLSSVSYEPSDYSCQTIMAYVRETAEPVVPVATEDVSPIPHAPGFWERFPFRINPNAVVATALVLFFAIGTMSLVYKLQRGTIIPNVGNIVQQGNPADLDPRFEWDDSDIRNDLDHIRNGIENLQTEPML